MLNVFGRALVAVRAQAVNAVRGPRLSSLEMQSGADLAPHGTRKSEKLPHDATGTRYVCWNARYCGVSASKT